MRYLNKIVFINSAHIKYAEVNLDGNVHFIGTQGVGKSTLLRAILFFYNADTLKLGIPVEKKTYTDYYFAHTNSYIVYEVVRNEETFCVVSYKSQHKVCFRFFDGAYDQKYFINDNGVVPDNWEGIAQQLIKNRIFYTKRKIDNHGEYRDILYGNHENRKSEFKKYALLESREYQNIPKTIQNVFLNSKMEAEFIKQTIIMSLENDIQIQLGSYTHHLKGFETQLDDIQKFKRPGTTTQANLISKLQTAIRHLEREKIKLAKELAYAYHEDQLKEPLLTEKLEKEKSREAVLAVKLAKASETFKTKENKSRGDIRVYDEKLKTAKKLSDEYERKGIVQIIERVEKKPLLEKEQRNFLSEYELLSAQFSELTLKFQALLDKIENQWHDFLNSKNDEILKIKTDFLNFKENNRRRTDKLVNDIRLEYRKQIDLARENFEARKQERNDLMQKKEGLKHKRFFEKEIEEVNLLIAALNNDSLAINAGTRQCKLEIGTLEKRWSLDTQDLQKTLDRGKEKSDEYLRRVYDQIAEIDSCLERSKNSLYSWLNDNYPGWENTIGRVIDEKNVLFNTSLAPKLSGKTNSFYGIELDLDEISKTVKTVFDYANEKSALNEQVAALRKNMLELTEKAEKDKENLKKKYQPQIREKKERIKENEYLLEQNKIRSDEASVRLNEYIQNAKVEKDKAIENIVVAIDAATEVELKAKEAIVKVEEELARLIKTRERELDKKNEAEAIRIEQVLAGIEQSIIAENAVSQSRMADINLQKQHELTNQGADTERLRLIENQLSQIRAELLYIDENRDTVSDYRKDKRELFDKADEFKNQKQLLELQLEQEERKYNQQIENIRKDLYIVQEIILSLKEELKHIREDQEAFGTFRISECYNTIQEYFMVLSDEFRTEKRVNMLIEEIREIHYDKLNSRIDELRKTITDFLGKFSDDNIFKFRKQLTDTKSFLDFAEMLSDFIEENKMERIEKEVNERFSLIITTIGKETTDLVSESGTIQNVVNKINDDFVKRNFAGVIKKIELKIVDSKNEVVQLLVMIKKYNDENSFDLGAANLFSSEGQEKKNKEAIDLLKQFVRKIGEMKRDYISLSDSFELKFRIEENQNDTGWVEKLSNVGSDGTDVLVKAMVNIMLLNVFKEGASKRFKDFRLHCMMDEIGKLHPNNVRGILKFANDRNIFLINSSPIENDALAFKHIYKLKKDEKSITRINRILTQYADL